MTRPSGRTQQLVGRVLDRPFPYGYFRIFITSHIPQSKSGKRLALLPFAPRFCFAYFVIVCALLPPDLFMQTAPRKYFRGAVTSAFFISSYLHFIFRHNLSCYFYLTVIYLNYQLSLIYICLECYLMSVAAGLFCRKMDGRFCRKKPDTDVRRAGRIDVAGVFCRTREGRGQSRSLH